MKIHTTNYFDTFIEIAADSPTQSGQIPVKKGETKTVANLTFEMISKHPYQFTSDEVLFQVFADKHDLLKEEYNEARMKFFAKGQACLRASPLTKRYGWGIHSNQEGKIALYGAETTEYEKMLGNDQIKKVKAMKSSR